jgi:hypothetical protein
MSFATTTQLDAHEKRHQEMREEAARTAAARKQNIEVFTRMFLALGPDAMKIAGTAHDAELAEAKALAAHRWNVLIDQEAQIEREEQALAGRPKKRPPQPGDDLLPDRTLEQRIAAWDDETKGQRENLATLKEITKNERRQMESWRVDFRRK